MFIMLISFCGLHGQNPLRTQRRDLDLNEVAGVADCQFGDECQIFEGCRLGGAVAFVWVTHRLGVGFGLGARRGVVLGWPICLGPTKKPTAMGRRRGCEDRRADLAYVLGMSTVSITWITPLSHSMSAVTTVALSMCTAPSLTATLTELPCTVGAAVNFMTSAAVTLPDTT